MPREQRHCGAFGPLLSVTSISLVTWSRCLFLSFVLWLVERNRRSYNLTAWIRRRSCVARRWRLWKRINSIVVNRRTTVARIRKCGQHLESLTRTRQRQKGDETVCENTLRESGNAARQRRGSFILPCWGRYCWPRSSRRWRRRSAASICCSAAAMFISSGPRTSSAAAKAWRRAFWMSAVMLRVPAAL